MILEADLRKLKHDPIELLTRFMQPVLWLGIFGVVISSSGMMSPALIGNINYLDFMAPGIIAQSALFLAIFSGITLIWDRDLGMLQKMMATPTPYTSIVAGKAMAAGVKGLIQSVFVFLLGIYMGVAFSLDAWRLALALLVLFLGTTAFAAISMTIATFVGGRDRMMGIGQMITMPVFFASNALYPIALMPVWLKMFSSVNPLSYEIDAMRGLLVTGQLGNLALDMFVLFAAVALSIFVGGRTLRKLSQ